MFTMFSYIFFVVFVYTARPKEVSYISETHCIRGLSEIKSVFYLEFYNYSRRHKEYFYY
jgi:hypothetical protein